MSFLEAPIKPGDSFNLNGNCYMFPSGSLERVPYEVGKAARVYQVIRNDKSLYALKVFFEEYKNDSIIDINKSIKGYLDLPGLKVAEREIITTIDQEILNRYPQFCNAVLMPWVAGKSWQNLIIDREEVEFLDGLNLSRELAQIFTEFEKRHLAHCDLSNGNFVFSPDFSNVELVDIEEMYGDGFSPPSPLPVGTDGYAPVRVVEDGYYGPDADRLSLSILIVEILCWQFEEVRQAREPMSLFASDEFGYLSKRYKLVIDKLSNLPESNEVNKEKIIQLFNQAWFSRWKDYDQKVEHSNIKDMYSECPLASDWLDALGKRPDGGGDPILEVSDTRIDFGTIDLNKETKKSRSIIIKNIGTGTLLGEIIPQPWIVVSPSLSFALPAKKELSVDVKLRLDESELKKEGQYRFPKGLVVSTNGGTEVISIRFRILKKNIRMWIAVGLACLALAIPLLRQIPISPPRATSTPISTKRSYTPTAKPTVKPTPVTMVRNYLDNASVSILDKFDTGKGWLLSAGTIENGILKIIGNDWNGLERKGSFYEGNGIVIEFRFTNEGDFEVFFDDGEFSTSSYRRLGIYINDSKPSTNIWIGDNLYYTDTFTGNLKMEPGKWYCLLMAIGEEGDFLVVIWDPSNLTQKLIYHYTLTSQIWSDKTWGFRIGANAGTIYFDDFEKIIFNSFSDDYQ